MVEMDFGVPAGCGYPYRSLGGAVVVVFFECDYFDGVFGVVFSFVEDLAVPL